MRIFTAEIKRLLKTRSILILMLAALLLAPVLACFPASFENWTYKDDSGQEVTVKGREALLKKAENQGQFQGEITEEKLLAALQRWQDFAAGYEGGLPDGIYDERVTVSDYCEKVSNVGGILNRMCEAWADPDTGMAPGRDDLTEGQATGFYSQCRQHIKDLIYLEGGGESARTDSAVRQALALYGQVEMPFTYEPGLTANAIEYVGIYVFLLVLICTFILVPVFVSDCQNQADQILKCARDGKRRLAVSRILAGLLLVSALYLICMALFLLLLNASFDFKGLNTSLQLLVSVSVFLPLTVGQLELLIGVAGFVSLLATAAFTLFLSGRMKTVASASIAAFAFLILPMVVYMILSGNIGKWIRCLLPAGGVGLINSFTYAAMDTGFAYLGNTAIWLPYLMMGAAAVEFFLFAVLAGVSWCRRGR